MNNNNKRITQLKYKVYNNFLYNFKFLFTIYYKMISMVKRE